MMKVRLEYIDLLKFFAIFSIIAQHCFLVWQNVEVMNIKVYGFSGILRFGVPIFIMISGALLLNRDIEIGSFLKKKTSRLVYPFIFFYIITFLFVFLTGHTHAQTSDIFFFRWYFWMILGVYLSIPIINKFIQHSSMKEISYFIYIFIFASIFYQITYILGIIQCFDLTLFLSPLGYLVLGYYLSKKEFNLSTNKIITLSIIIFLISSFIESLIITGSIPMTEFNLANSSIGLTSYLDVNIIKIIQSASLFILCKYIYQSNSIYKPIKNFLKTKIISKFVISVSRASYGMYLINLIPQLILYYYIKPLKLSGLQSSITIIGSSIIIFLVSWIIIIILSKIPYIKYLSGYA